MRYPFIVNSVDFSELANKYGYTTDRIPVYSNAWRDLSGVDHHTKIRDKGYLIVTLNDITAEQSLSLCQQLRKTPVLVTYHSFQLGTTVTERMRIDTIPRSLLMIDGSTTIHEAVPLEFEQL